MTINISLLSDIIQTRAPQLFVDQVTRLTGFLEYLRASGLIVGPSDAKGPRWRVKTSGSSSAATFAEGAPQPAATEFGQVEASLSWGAYTDTVSITSQAQAQFAASGANYIQNYIVEQFTDHAKQMASLIQTHLLSGINANGITGITEAIDDTNTYASVNRGVYTNFASYINDNGGVPRAVSITLLDAVHNYLLETIGGNYVKIWTSHTQLDKMTALSSGNGLLAPYQVFGSGENAVKSIGYTGLQYRGREVLAFPGYPSGRIDFVDPMAFRLEVLPATGNPVANDMLGGAIKIQQLANVNGDANFRMEFFGQLACTSPRMHTASLQDLS